MVTDLKENGAWNAIPGEDQKQFNRPTYYASIGYKS
jgi:hypothetical protein